jgi:hypothetical protein
VVTPSETALSLTDVPGKRNINIDSGCLVTTPYGDDVQLLISDNTPTLLANHSLVSVTHKGVVRLPFGKEANIPALVVPDLHEPLLSVAGLCDQNLTVVFTSKSCKIFHTADVSLPKDPIGCGYWKGNLFYLPLSEVHTHSAALTPSASHDSILLRFHLRLSHVGL